MQSIKNWSKKLAFINWNQMRKFIFIGLLLITSLSIQAQSKYGHINLGNLISELPEAQAANSDLEAFQNQMIARGQEMAAAFKIDYDAVVKKVQAGLLTPVQQQEQQTILEKEQQKIALYERQIQVDVAKKRDELLEPIVSAAQAAISAVAKEKGLQFVFDTSIYGAIMYAAESEDIMELVKAKLAASK